MLPALPQLCNLVVTAQGWCIAHLPVATFSSLESLRQVPGHSGWGAVPAALKAAAGPCLWHP